MKKKVLFGTAFILMMLFTVMFQTTLVGMADPIQVGKDVQVQKCSNVETIKPDTAKLDKNADKKSDKIKDDKGKKTKKSDDYAKNCNMKVTAKSAILMDYDTGTILFRKDENKKLPIASMMKIMTALLTFEALESGHIKMDDMVEVSETAASMGGSQIFLDANTKHKLSDLLKAIIVASANDACVAMAEHIESGVENFVGKMNDRAKELGMANTHFANCTGLPAPENFSCAKDVSIMTRELLKHDKYFKFSKVWLEDYKHPDGRKTCMTNTNKLVRFYKGCDGGKTGFTQEAKFCLSATARRNDMRVVAVVIGVDNSKVRFKEASNLMNYAFKNFENKILLDKNECIPNSVEILRGKSNYAVLETKERLTAFVKRGEKSKFEIKYDLPKKIKAPLKKGTVVGKAYLIKNSVVQKTCPIVLRNDMKKANLLDDLKRVLKNW